MAISDEQRIIATAPPQARILVLAGPGTGKTHTLLHRLVNLVTSEGLSPRNDVLVLSFSRAAVTEIRQRLKAMSGQSVSDDIRFLNVRTFDSFATRLLTAREDDLNLSGCSYDARIALAAERLRDANSSSTEAMQGVQHVVVDEIQDLVGVRARLVQAILEIIPGGFTLLGDPAQAIYEYLVRSPADGPTSGGFLDWVKMRFAETLKTYELDRNYRIKDGAANVAAQVRAIVLGEQGDRARAYSALHRLVDELPGAGTVHEPDVTRLETSEVRTAILCRTNADVAFTFNCLKQHGLRCLIPPSADEIGLPPWIGRVLSEVTVPRLEWPTFEALWKQRIGDKYPISSSDSWALLKGIESRDQRDLDLGVLTMRLRHGVDWSFDSDARAAGDQTLVTTIHQSKGREYDRVAIVLPEFGAHCDKDEAIEEAKVLYVAATRAREALVRLGRHGLPITYENVMPSKRKRRLGQDSRNRHYFEVGAKGDVWDEGFVNNGLFVMPEDSSRTQELIWRKLGPGTSLNLVARTFNGSLRYVLVWERPDKNLVPVGMMDRDFVIDLEAYSCSISLDKKPHLKPGYATLTVVERRTVVLPAYSDDTHRPYCLSGLCLGLAVRGLIRMETGE